MRLYGPYTRRGLGPATGLILSCTRELYGPDTRQGLGPDERPRHAPRHATLSPQATSRRANVRSFAKCAGNYVLHSFVRSLCFGHGLERTSRLASLAPIRDRDRGAHERDRDGIGSYVRCAVGRSCERCEGREHGKVEHDRERADVSPRRDRIRARNLGEDRSFVPSRDVHSPGRGEGYDLGSFVRSGEGDPRALQGPSAEGGRRREVTFVADATTERAPGNRRSFSFVRVRSRCPFAKQATYVVARDNKPPCHDVREAFDTARVAWERSESAVPFSVPSMPRERIGHAVG